MKAEGGMNCRIRLHAKLWMEEPVTAGEPVRVYLPVPTVDGQVKAVTIVKISGEPEQITVAPENALQRTVCWETTWQPDTAYEVEYEYEIQAGYLDLWSGPYEKEDLLAGGAEPKGTMPEKKNTSPEHWQMARDNWMAKYRCNDPVVEDDLAEQLPHITFSVMMRRLTEEVVGEETRPLEKARRIYNYVTTRIHYSYMRSYVTLPVISEYVASGHKGDCGAQSILFITMCRIAGIPARWQSGKYANPARVGNHDWARFYIEEYGWLYADCSFGGGGNRSGNEEQRRFYFGNLDPFRMISCRRFQSDFIPPMRKLRSDPYDAQSGEVELEGEKHYQYPWDSDTWMVSWEKIQDC
jgi:transglutaminase-like putative cysteine protease